VKRKIKLIKGITKITSTVLAFEYALSLAYGQIVWMQSKSVFVQTIPLFIAFLICALCED